MTHDRDAMEWRPCPGFPDYIISEYGDIIRTTSCRQSPSGREITQKVTYAGYLDVGLSISGKQYYRRVNRLVCEAWHGPPPSPKSHACHTDGVRTNNHYSNLRWASCAENHQDKHQHGTWMCGSKHPLAKLTEELVATIKRRLLQGDSATILSTLYGVPKSKISSIKHGRSWKHVVV